jgi:hypothetical protein
MRGLQFDPGPHVYTLDGVPVPSVTQVLTRAGLIDFSKVPPHILDAARRRGTVVHQAIHYFNEHDLDVDQFVTAFPDYAGYLRAWIAFTEQRHFEAPRGLCECRVASRRHQVAGTADCFGFLDGVAVLLDFATGRPSDVAKDLQTAAYFALATEWAAEEDGDQNLLAFLTRARGVLKRYAVALRADGSFELEPYTAQADFRDFWTLVAAQHLVRRRRAARGYDAPYIMEAIA